MRHFEAALDVAAPAADVFAFIDDHERFSAHMTQSSWMTAGGRMETVVDSGHGRAIGSHIRMSGKVLGVRLDLDEVVTVHEPPRRKAWETVGQPNLLVVGAYKMAVDVEPRGDGSHVRVGIDYEVPEKHRLLGRLFGGLYARWCVKQMVGGVGREFRPPA